MLDSQTDLISREGQSNPDILVSAENLAYVNYTSGSTGTPKGVEVLHRGVVRLLMGTDYAELDASKTFLQLSTISFDASTFELWAPLLHGGCCVLFPERVPTVEALGETIRKHGVDTLWLTASLFNAVVDEKPEVLGGIRQLLIGGETLSPKHVHRALERLPDTKIINGYGPTEGTTFTCCYTIPRDRLRGRCRDEAGAFEQSAARPLVDAPDSKLAESIPIGRPIANTTVFVLDRNLEAVPVGVPGELYIGGDGIARGYLNRPELTKEKFIPCPFRSGPSDRLYRSGDSVRWQPDGNLDFLGRLDNQVKIRGFRIEPGEIESVLMQHPLVKQATVLAREEQSGEKRLVAYFVPHSQTPVTTADLRSFLVHRLPEFMVPSAFVQLAEFPLTAGGKIDRRSLPAPDGPPGDAEHGGAAPRTQTEKILAALWADLLHLDRVGIHDNFFDLGGHSLTAVRLVSEIEKRFGKRLPLWSLFDHGTIARQALLLEKDSGWTADAAAVLLRRGDAGRPLFLVHSMGGEVSFWRWFVQHLENDRPFYGLRPPQRDGITVALPELREMARSHVASIHRVQPEGPYCIAGYSYGGKVALEIAQQLVACGQKVALLAMIEAGPSPPARRSPSERLLMCGYFLRNVPFWVLDNLVLAGPREIMAQVRVKGNETRNRIARLLAGGWSAARDLHVEDIFDLTNVPDSYRAIQKTHYDAWQAYDCLPYPGRIVVFRSRTGALTHDFEPDFGWSRLALGGVEVRVIPGHHWNIMREPRVVRLAQELQSALDEADRAADQTSHR